MPFVSFIDLCNITGCGFATVLGVQGWRSGDSTCPPPMWPGFDSQTWCHMWVEFVVGSCYCSDGFSLGSLVFLPPQKPTPQIPIGSPFDHYVMLKCALQVLSI